MVIQPPGLIPRDALDYFRAKALKPSFSWEDVFREEHAAVFTVAKAMQLDILRTIREALDQSLADGKTFQQFRRELEPKLQKLGWWGVREVVDPATGERIQAELGSPRRLRIIYNANLRAARAVGQWQRIQRNKKSHPYLLYQLGPSREHRLQHVAWHGLLLPVDDPFWQTAMPPNGWGCKCRVRAVSRREYERLQARGVPDPVAAQIINPETGLPTGHRENKRVAVKLKAPTLNFVKHVNKRTGEVIKVPQGIDPGWDYNPGVSRLRQLRQRLMVKQRDYPIPREILVAQFVQQLKEAPAVKQPPLIFESIPATVLSLNLELESLLRDKWITLDHDSTVHTLRHHGSDKKERRGQVPVMTDDLTHIVAIIGAAIRVQAGRPPRSNSGAQRIEVISQWQGYRYTLVLEVRRKKNRVILFDMWKRKL